MSETLQGKAHLPSNHNNFSCDFISHYITIGQEDGETTKVTLLNIEHNFAAIPIAIKLTNI